MMQPTIVAIIPAYNEAKRISAVLEVLRQVECLDEILVIDDGSNDGTADIVRRAIASDSRLRLLQHQTNLGKGQAIFSGRAATTASYILLLDADLVGLTSAHVDALIRPVVERRADMTVGIFRGGRWNTDLAHRLTPWLSGQRCLRAEILDKVPREAAAGYGFETALTVSVVQNGYRTQLVPLRGVWHIPSELHRKNGFCWRLHMYAQILRAWKASGGWKIWWQNLRKRLVFLTSLVILALLLLEQYRAQASASLPPT
ncbi:MAG: glycosyltransferase family 2 protein, partial [Anaerolineales bacterium]